MHNILFYETKRVFLFWFEQLIITAKKNKFLGGNV